MSLNILNFNFSLLLLIFIGTFYIKLILHSYNSFIIKYYIWIINHFQLLKIMEEIFYLILYIFFKINFPNQYYFNLIRTIINLKLTLNHFI